MTPDNSGMRLTPEEQKHELLKLNAAMDSLATVRLEDLQADISFLQGFAPFFDPTGYQERADNIRDNKRIVDIGLRAQQELYKAFPHISSAARAHLDVDGLTTDTNMFLVGLQGEHVVILRPRSMLTPAEARNLARFLGEVAGYEPGLGAGAISVQRCRAPIYPRSAALCQEEATTTNKGGHPSCAEHAHLEHAHA